ncbi:DUF6308 family protein [Rhodococcus sp. NPDC019627]|uniref:DUF6308 family protein n=1 Tax=unclassified Rhodococcus (in: high G+C Gram-positive bacteria) TaxID=192944 RepID=UPI0037AFC2DF
MRFGRPFAPTAERGIAGCWSIREEAGPPEQISALRVFDVIAWMEGKNRGLGERSELGR